MPRQTEPNANNALESLLQEMLPGRHVRSENTQTITGRPGLRPDIIVTAPSHSAVVIEAEYMPARTVESEARLRLGLEVTASARVIEAAIALRYPAAVGDARDLRDALSSSRHEYCVFTEDGGESRFPESGWMDGSVENLADMVRLVSVPQRAVDRATTTLQEGIDFFKGQNVAARVVMVVGALGTIGLIAFAVTSWAVRAYLPNGSAVSTPLSLTSKPSPTATPAPTPTPTLASLLEAAESIRSIDHRSRALRLVAETAVEQGDYDIAIKAGEGAIYRREVASGILAFTALCAANDGLFDLAKEAASHIPTSDIHDRVLIEILVVESSRISNSVQGMHVECPGRDPDSP